MAFPEKLLNDGERVVLSTRTHPKALLLPLLALVLLLALAVVLQTVVSGALGGIVTIVVWVVVVVAIVWFALRPFLAWWTTTYTFTDRRFVKRSGFIAKEGRTIPLNRISGVDFEIGVVDRVFGCGTLVVTDASEHGQVLLHDIPHVEEVQKQVAAELDRNARGRGHDDGA
ncbi:PH domain-containing protein [Nocardioides coralli]|uniref:PH domain-containing protein n=1 Tax=Nocardioides coralli TaxID=2872154 RepID=UPI001CA3D046|nr:PH domain-containing protein [Nocardioides coralli]QZY29983.1 PH domain-containing protein [Nocardioides coralli]